MAMNAPPPGWDNPMGYKARWGRTLPSDREAPSGRKKPPRRKLCWKYWKKKKNVPVAG